MFADQHGQWQQFSANGFVVGDEVNIGHDRFLAASITCKGVHLQHESGTIITIPHSVLAAASVRPLTRNAG